MAIAAAATEEPATRFAKDQLKAIIERIERLEEEKKTISDDIRDVYAEARATATTSRRCAPSCGCASRTPTSAPSRKPFWRRIFRRWECSEAGNLSCPPLRAHGSALRAVRARAPRSNSESRKAGLDRFVADAPRNYAEKERPNLNEP